MASTKVIVATESHKRKDWTIVLTGTESRNAAVKALSTLESKGLQLVSGASPFAEPKKQRPKKVKAEETIIRAVAGLKGLGSADPAPT